MGLGILLYTRVSDRHRVTDKVIVANALSPFIGIEGGKK